MKINHFELPIGKQSFIASVEAIRNEEEDNYYGNMIVVPYIYFKDIKIIIDDKLVDVETSGIPVRSKIGKKLSRLNLKENDIISFNARVYRQDIEFYHWDNQDNPTIYHLPKNYKGTIKFKIYATTFSKYGGRLEKMNYTEETDREEFERVYKDLNFKIRATDNQNGLFQEVQNKYYNGRKIKYLSHIVKQE